MELSAEQIRQIVSQSLKFLAIATESEMETLLSSRFVSSNKQRTVLLNGERSKIQKQIDNNQDLHVSNSLKKIDNIIDGAKSEDAVIQMLEVFQERVEQLEATSMVIDVTKAALSGEGDSTFTLPLKGENVEFKVEEFNFDEIETKTEVIYDENSRDQESLENEPKTKELVSLISDFGQFMPAIAHRREGSSKLSILDGSRRRYACLQAGKSFRVIVASRELSVTEIAILKKIFQSQKELTYYEQCVDFCHEAEEFKRNWKIKNPGEKFSYEKHGQLKGISSRSKVYRIKNAGGINKCIVASFHDQKLLGESFFSRYLTPLVKKLERENIPDYEVSLVGFIGREYERYEENLWNEYDKDSDLKDVGLEDDIPVKIIKKAHNYFFEDKSKPQVDDSNKKYLLGNKDSKNFIFIEDKGKFKKVTAKFTDPERLTRFTDLIESLNSEEDEQD